MNKKAQNNYANNAIVISGGKKRKIAPQANAQFMPTVFEQDGNKLYQVVRPGVRRLVDESIDDLGEAINA